MLREYFKLTLLAVTVLLFGIFVASQIFYYDEYAEHNYVRINRITGACQMHLLGDPTGEWVSEIPPKDGKIEWGYFH